MKYSTMFAPLSAKLFIALATSLMAASAFAAPVNTFENPGFENPSVGSGNFVYLSGFTLDGWTYIGNSGIAANGSAFSVTGASGNQAAFIQVGNSKISQSFDFSGGMFSLGFLSEFRGGYGANPVIVTVDGITLTFNGDGSFTPTSSSAFTAFASDALALDAGSHVLTFSGTSTADLTTFIDDLTISATEAGANDVPEPASLALFAIGALGAAGIGRRRKS